MRHPLKTEALEQYSQTSVAAYEAVYGQDFISPGGQSMARHFAARLELEPGQKVLDVGSGLGGYAFLMASEYRAEVVGVDLTDSMVGEATARAQQRGCTEFVHFRQQDCLELEEIDHFDAVTSRDVFLHIHQKERLLGRLWQVLKPGGRLLFTDYICSPKPWPWAFTAYVESRNYCLHTLSEYQDLLGTAGFVELDCQDITDRFIETLETELKRLPTVQELGWATRKGLGLAWKSKLRGAQQGVHRWGVFSARKPSS